MQRWNSISPAEATVAAGAAGTVVAVAPSPAEEAGWFLSPPHALAAMNNRPTSNAEVL
jgi:hypothetical protein